MPSQIVAGSVADSEAAWRGAFLAHGSLTEPGRSASLEITCPGPEAALALVGSARRLGIAAKAREVRGADRVVVRDGDAIAAMLTRLGAHHCVLTWEDRRLRREVRASAEPAGQFRRRQPAPVRARRGGRLRPGGAGAGDSRATTLPNTSPQAGQLRIQHGQASLEELGALASPPMTKDAIAGRIRRLLTMADRRAHEDGVPDTESAVTPDMLDS